MAEDTQALQGGLTSLAGFQVERVLSEDAHSKSVAVLGRFAGADDGTQAIVRLSKRHFQLDSLQELVDSGIALEMDFHNDIYNKFAAVAPERFNRFTVDTIYPCTPKHIAKHETQSTVMVSETPEVYNAAVLPYVESIPPAHIQWVYNILEGKKEAERVLLRDTDPETGFVLLPDLKWDQAQVRQLYCVAIVNRRDVRSLRDLREEHLPLLENVLNEGCRAIKERFGVERRALKVYLHYSPSYFHLHMHFAHTALGSAGNGAGKGHLLEDVMGNIRTFGADYYARATLQVEIGEASELMARIQSYQDGGPGPKDSKRHRDE